MTVFDDPAWNALLRQSDADEAFAELEARLDREIAFTPHQTCTASPAAVQTPGVIARGSSPVPECAEQAAQGRGGDTEDRDASAGTARAA